MATITSAISDIVFSEYDSTLGAYRRVDFNWVLSGATSETMSALMDTTNSAEIDVPAISSPHSGTFTLDFTSKTPTQYALYAFYPGHTVVFSDIANGYWDGVNTVTGDSSLGVVPPAPAPTIALYGSVNSLSASAKKMYGRGGTLSSFDGDIQTGGAGNISSFNGATFCTTMLQDYDFLNYIEGETSVLSTLQSIIVSASADASAPDGIAWMVMLLFDEGFEYYVSWSDASTQYGPSLANLGITLSLQTAGNDQIKVTPIFTSYSARRVDHMYGSITKQGVTGFSGSISAGGIGNVTAFNGNTFWETLQTIPWYVQAVEADSSQPMSLECSVYEDSYGNNIVNVFLTIGSDNYGDICWGGYLHTPQELGITLSSCNEGSDYITLTPTTGSVERATLIYQGFDHLNYN